MMPSNRFIAREDDVLDLETGIRYSTADDAEAVADLLNSTPPQPVSGDVVAAVKALLAEWNSEDFELAGLKICMDNLAAALASSPDSETAGWQPIETAPKDGTWAILSTGSEVVVGCYDADDFGGRWSDGNYGYLPTHWMPLPAAPSTQGEAKA